MAEAIVQKEGVSGEVAAEVAEEVTSSEQGTPRLKITDEPRCAEMVGKILKWAEERLKAEKVSSVESETFCFESKALGLLVWDVQVVFIMEGVVRAAGRVTLDVTKLLKSEDGLCNERVASFGSNLEGEGVYIGHREVLDVKEPYLVAGDAVCSEDVSLGHYRRGVGTTCFDILEGIAVVSGGSHARMDLLVSLVVAENGDSEPCAVQADVLGLALGRGYLPDGEFSEETVARIKALDGVKVGKDQFHRSKAFPTDRYGRFMCMVKKDLRVSKEEGEGGEAKVELVNN